MTEHERARQVEAAQRLFAVRKTVSEMLQARGYVVSERELNETFDDFTAQFGDTPKRAALFRLAKKRDESDTCLVFMPENEKVGAKDVEDYWKQCKSEGATRGILIIQNSITPFAKTMIAHMEGLVLELFKEEELLVNITKHVLVPKHILLTKEEAEALLRRYKLKESQLPRIQTDDPIARFYGLRPGQIVKIIRRSETAGRYVTYRWVV